jgi:hypothetical protein
MNASGEFDVTLRPAELSMRGKFGIALGRMTIDKTFRGELAATSRGEMLSVRSEAGRSAGYVAIEQVTGSLHGKSGSFVLQHYGMTERNESRLLLEIVADSGTDELAGIRGSMDISIDGGKHRYSLEYEL